MATDRRTPLFPFDAGWLFLLPGLALLSATVLIPAYNDLMDARWSRDRAAAIEQNRLDRLNRYGVYLDALEREDPSVVKSLAASQLNMVPESFEPLAPMRDPSNIPATVFPLLEPDPSVVPNVPPAREQSRLEVWSTSDRTRVWLIAAGGLCVLVGLLPTAVRSADRHAARWRGTDSPTPAPGVRARAATGRSKKPAPIDAPQAIPVPSPHRFPAQQPDPPLAVPASPVAEATDKTSHNPIDITPSDERPRTKSGDVGDNTKPPSSIEAKPTRVPSVATPPSGAGKHDAEPEGDPDDR